MDYRELLKKYKQYLIVGMILVLSISGSIFFMIVNSKQKQVEDPDEALIMNSTSVSQSLESESISQQIYVDIKGAVEKPGMYEGRANMRVWDAVMLAGGVNEEADTKQVNFSERITDQMVIYVPKVGEELQVENKNGDAKENPSKDTSKVDLNQADESELQTLPSIGQKKAQEIIRYREEKGGFKTIDELKNISGFGEKTFEKLKESIKV
ncbi:hypothetical protein A5819_002713 [Enterococcus sp. 7E2_DIV0204]|uniref:Competence protein ComEA n=1 Tax=Candidatus Enterococcus lemimoniae TaxID=1834167 RepID=A0ABZ2T2S0_9ENTE|nr:MULTISPECIES: helix-hairpin-helix domain-containing protein [unclassified Enterococcus]OTN90214.1 hypothetical protein A5819_002713 [Enterococcus sp. 7E2_DIV0204]OTO69074.1 hypothetical protein A5866_001273 [Enterococcus sp. 12C11_DIV0727]OTP52670.1 hypothetical protein A5884_001872 [Enterococcus sp. 7D2_DIV0200]